MVWDPEFEVAFNPKTVAVVGASRETLYYGDFVGNLQHAGFPGRIYPINPKAAGGEIHGLKTYPPVGARGLHCGKCQEHTYLHRRG